MDPSTNNIKRISRGTQQSKAQENYNFGGDQANRNAYAGSVYSTPNYNRNLESVYNYEYFKTRSTEYYNPIDNAYQISRQTNCMGGSPRLPGLLPCPYGTDAIACASYSASQENFSPYFNRRRTFPN